MKAKRISAFIIIISILLTLCSCSFIDEMKSVHGYFTDDTKTVIRFGGNDYLLYDKPLNYRFEITKDVYITEPDRPLLLSQIQPLNSDFYINSDSSVIWGHGISNDDIAYIRSDMYDECAKILENGNLTEYCHYPNDFYYKYGIAEEMILTKFDQQTKAIFEEILKTEPIIRGEDDYIEESTNIYICDDSMRVIKDAYNIGLMNGTEYIIMQYGYDLSEITNIYRIDKKYYPIFKNLAEPIPYDPELVEEYM